LSLDLPQGKLPKPSWVKISQVRTLSVERIGKRADAWNRRFSVN
jgi:mRNA interferase MazF